MVGCLESLIPNVRNAIDEVRKLYMGLRPTVLDDFGVVAAVGCDMLLDLAHARVSADILGYDVYDYLLRLPLDRVRELHLSGPRPLGRLGPKRQKIILDNARTVADRMLFAAHNLVDAHEPLDEADYALLEWTLARTQPWAISLEYFRRPQALREQLARLAAIIGR